MAKQNCWQHMKCGREPEGSNVNELGVCPAATEKTPNGINSGKNGGRACWALVGTLCGGVIQATFAKKIANCIHCSFYKKVLKEEGVNFVPSLEIIEILGERKGRKITE